MQGTLKKKIVASVFLLYHMPDTSKRLSFIWMTRHFDVYNLPGALPLLPILQGPNGQYQFLYLPKLAKFHCPPLQRRGRGGDPLVTSKDPLVTS